MATAIDIRAAMKRCATKATEDYPADIQGRSVAFLARLTGSLEHLGEAELAELPWSVTCTAPYTRPE
ncbi:hypothetical protein ACFSQU_18000 [Massilia sp. GCM10020059]|uniref:DUF4089 domain-containing protein n=1 Tax=Massilia agrisoli TaxID=2892444 RepID=A0ABS8IS21_9BURK|nr:hypothetical protein [Massilia agrisoli]MCC6071435.1 hypothetical protein [Massilia agrisoli]